MGAEGIVFTHSEQNGLYELGPHDGKDHFLYNKLAEGTFTTSSNPLPTGRVVLVADIADVALNGERE